jgi:hypothetical protein
MSTTDDLTTLRDMSGKAIKATYKGILRISNNWSLINEQGDEFLNETYYYDDTNTNKNISWFGDSSHTAVDSTYKFIAESSEKRFKDETSVYTHLKIPVTDSMGNYLNFRLGVDGACVGFDISPGQFSSGKETLGDKKDKSGFSILNVNSEGIHVGLSPLKHFKDKTISGGHLIIDNITDNTTDSTDSVGEHSNDAAKLVIKNYYYHTKDGIASTPDGKSYRTIFSHNHNPEEYSAFVYDQENYEKSEDSNIIDCKVTLENIKDYISEKVEDYLKLQVPTVPTGTIISQFCDLDKWFCVVDSSTTGLKMDDFSNTWQGYRPSMAGGQSYEHATSAKGNYGSTNVLNGAYIHDTFLYDLHEKRSKELPPDFKRGYLLCDGSEISISLMPKHVPEYNNAQSKYSLELFFDLFHVIGHHYWIGTAFNSNSLSRPRIHRCVENVGFSVPSDTSGGVYYKYYNPTADSSSGEINHGIGNLVNINEFITSDTDSLNTDPGVIYGITMATILAFRYIQENYEKWKAELDNYDEMPDDDKIKNLIKDKFIGKELDRNYIFNVIVPSYFKNGEIKNSFYKYTTSQGKEIGINIGVEVKSFSGYIPYYVYNEETGKVKLTTCKLYQMAEVYELLKLFFFKPSGYEKSESIPWSSIIANKYTYRYKIPSFYTYKTSNLVKSGEASTFKIGHFVGSNGLVLANKLELQDANSTSIKTIKPGNGCTSIYEYNTNCRFSQGFAPHVHAVAKGKIVFADDNPSGSNTQIELHDSGYSYVPRPYLDDKDTIKKDYETVKIPSKPKTNVFNIASDTIGGDEYTAAADYHYTSYNLYKGKEKKVGDRTIPPLSGSDMYNYILQSVGTDPETLAGLAEGDKNNGDKSKGDKNKVLITEVYNSFSGSAGYEWQNWESASISTSTESESGTESESTESEKYLGYKWYAKTDEPIWELKNDEEITAKYNYTDSSRIWYFRPESIKVLPLIKL